MLVLFETSAGYSLFKVNNEKKFNKTDAEDIQETFFSSKKSMTKHLSLVNFQPLKDMADAFTAVTSCIEGKLSKTLKSMLKKHCSDDNSTLAVADKTLGNSIKSKLDNITCVENAKVQELFRGIRGHMDDLFGDSLTGNDLKAMQLGLSHSLSRYKLKFSADKVDTMVIQAVGLLDDLDKEINIYAIRTRVWYGWHFPEMVKVVADHVQYSKCILVCGTRTNYSNANLSAIIEDETVVEGLKSAAQISTGTEISEADIEHIQQLASQVVGLMEYRAQLFGYLKNRMNAIAPNLTLLVGELVGARLISHAGSLMNSAKCPASTVQILGAEKALFRALKTKHDTPKYGLIYHASLIGQAAPKNKGKISRVLAAKSALAIRVDALSDEATADTAIGHDCRAKFEARLRQLEGGVIPVSVNKNGELTSKKTSKYVAPEDTNGYNVESDMAGLRAETPKSEKKKKSKKEKKKRKADEMDDDEAPTNGGSEKKKKKKKDKKAKKE
mmetsp:Transcript_4271/g.6555  ORF Transcript_4271/g.6555 Transcript_4271/m.6555 type:complete len:499 (-) Transcript_4271:185-1681(-)